MSASQQNLDNFIRKLRKKLRQIENLERLNRSLTEDEVIKLNSKDEVREKLQDALEEYQVAVETDERDVVGSTSSQVQKPSSVNRAVDADTSRHDHLEELDQSTKQLTPSSDHNTSTENRILTRKHDQGDRTKLEPKVKVRSELAHSYCQVSYLEGHSDLITALVVVGDKVVTASRDTTLKFWDITLGTEIHSYGGHTGSVVSLLVLDDVDEPCLPENDKLLISGSLDSTFKLWALHSGQLLRSVYTYSPVLHIGYCFPAGRLITGSDGGKLELWNLASGENTFSSRAHTASITGLKISNNAVYSSASDGIIRIDQVTESGHLVCLFVSEAVKTVSGSPLVTRHIRCLALHQDMILFGDDARNIKLLDWKKGLVTKLSNHTNSFSFTDALSCHGELLLSSSYDLDQGLGYINIRSSRRFEYLATIDDESTERIVCLDFGYSSSNNLFVVTGGMDLKLWQVLPAQSVNKSTEQVDEDIFQLEFRPALAQLAVDSETESSNDDSDYEDESYGSEPGKVRSDISSNGWLSWCTLL